MRLMTMLVLALVLPSAGRGAAVEQPHSRAELIAERTALEPGQTVTVALRLQLEEHWHVYWKNPGDSGMANTMQSTSNCA